TCWCVTTFTPGAPLLEAPQIGQASYGKTGFGDLLVRAKGTVLRTRNAAMAIGVDVRAPTGNEANYLGVGAASAKPFFAVSLYSKPFRNGVVLSPHLDVGWQFTGKSILAGDVTGTSQANGATGAPYSFSKNYVPDVFSWAIGAEAALGRRNTILVDVFSN